MSDMFALCSSLKELDLSNFNTINTTDMKGMFFSCTNELKIKIRNQNNNFQEEAFQ